MLCGESFSCCWCVAVWIAGVQMMPVVFRWHIQINIVVRYLASGESFTSLMYTFKISKQSISAIIPEVCEALINALKTYIKVSN